MEKVSFNLILSTDGSISDVSPRCSRIARKLLSDMELSPGGMIVLSTDVTKVESSGIIGWAKRNLMTWWNRLQKNNIVDEELSTELKNRGMESGWSIGNLFRGRFYSQKTDKTFNEKSFSIEIRGVPFDFIIQAARKLGKDFQQECVLVIDHSNGRTIMLDV